MNVGPLVKFLHSLSFEENEALSELLFKTETEWSIYTENGSQDCTDFPTMLSFFLKIKDNNILAHRLKLDYGSYMIEIFISMLRKLNEIFGHGGYYFSEIDMDETFEFFDWLEATNAFKQRNLMLLLKPTAM